MCKLLLAISKTPKNEEFNKVIRAQYESMTNQKNGIAGLVITHGGELHLFRDYTDYDRVFEAVDGLLDEAKVVSLHTRIATGGTYSLDNVHYFEHDGYLLAHNGTVPKFYNAKGCGIGFVSKKDGLFDDIDFKARIPESEFYDEVEQCPGCTTTKDQSGYCKKHRRQWLFNVQPDGLPLVVLDKDKAKEDDKKLDFDPCDSHQFLINMPKPLTREKLKAFIEETSMNGMMTIVEKKSNRIWMVIKKEVVVVTDKKTFDVYCSFDPDLKVEKTIWLYRNGVPFIDKKVKTTLNYKPRTVSYGTYEVNYQE